MGSSWELAYYVWCVHNNINIIRNKDTFEYVYKNKYRTYLPDFYLVDKDLYIEIKGKGVWFIKEEVNAKISSVNNLQIYYKNDLKDIFKEVCSLYNVKNTVKLSELLYDR